MACPAPAETPHPPRPAPSRDGAPGRYAWPAPPASPSSGSARRSADRAARSSSACAGYGRCDRTPPPRPARLLQRVLAGMAEGRVADIVRQAQRLGQVLVQPQRCVRSSGRSARPPGCASGGPGNGRHQGAMKTCVLWRSRRNAIEWMIRSRSRWKSSRGPRSIPLCSWWSRPLRRRRVRSPGRALPIIRWAASRSSGPRRW